MGFSHGTERSAGVTTAINVFKRDFLQSESDPAGQYIFQVIELYNRICIIINIHGYNSSRENNNISNSLESKIDYWLSKIANALLLIGGDLTLTVDNWMDRCPLHIIIIITKMKFLMNKFHIVDVWWEKFPHGTSFTWSNRLGTKQSPQ